MNVRDISLEEKLETITFVVETPRKCGTAFLIRVITGGAIFLTASHVVDNYSNVTLLHPDGRSFDAIQVWSKHCADGKFIDASVLFVTDPEAFVGIRCPTLPAPLPITDTIERALEDRYTGRRVLSRGFPNMRAALSQGSIIASCDIEGTFTGSTGTARRFKLHALLSSMKSRSGQSGSPAVDAEGHLVGMMLGSVETIDGSLDASMLLASEWLLLLLQHVQCPYRDLFLTT